MQNRKTAYAETGNCRFRAARYAYMDSMLLPSTRARLSGRETAALTALRDAIAEQAQAERHVLDAIRDARVAGMCWDGPDVLRALAAMRVRVATSGAAERQGIVSRLDVGTSGAMVVAKGERAYSVLKRAFRERAVGKVYHAVVQGHLDPASGTINALIGCHPGREWRMAVVDGGRESVTHYNIVESMPLRSGPWP